MCERLIQRGEREETVIDNLAKERGQIREEERNARGEV